MFPVETYRAEWNARTNKGRVLITVARRESELPIESAEEFGAVLLVLSKTNVQFDPTQGAFEILARPAGS
jgi:hypothetical protein